MDPTGDWTVNEQQIEIHIRELQKQLQACKSVLAWVQAWNIYAARFVANNFGEPANCLGRPHLVKVIEALEKIQSGIFASPDLPGDNAAEHLRQKLATEYGVEGIPDGFFYFPIELGGLGLRNPMLLLYMVRKNSIDDPGTIIDEALELEVADYYKAKKEYEDGTSHSRLQYSVTQGDKPCMSLDEYTRYREETSEHLYRAYIKSLDAPRKTRIEQPPDTLHALRTLPSSSLRPDACKDWILQLYGSEIIKNYGGLALAEKIFLPIGFASMLGSEKVRWQE